MQLRLRTERDVRAFSIAVTVVALVGNLLLQLVLMPPDIVPRIQFSGSVITLTLSAPISYFVGMRMLDIHLLTVTLERAVSFDGLTGARTRRSFYDIAAAQPPDSLAAIILTDIDRFKSFNDRFGHQAGDAALGQFSRTLLRNLREEDVVARFGGEEFVILLPGTTLGQGQKAAERLRLAIRDTVITIGGQAVTLTASFGVSVHRFPGDIDAGIGCADLALYRAKHKGRDRICVDDPACDTRKAHTP